MWQYLFFLFRRQPGKSALASSGFLLAACALILLSATTQTTFARANQIINQNWRPTYDLVVLPSQVKIPSDQRVPADLLEGYSGGISIQQYEQIKHLPGIEVAAPIAYVGYIHMPPPIVYFSDHLYPSGYYQLDASLIAFDGQRTIVEAQESEIIYIDDSASDLTSSTPPPGLDELSRLGVRMLQTESSDDFYISIGGESTTDTGTFLLTGIDPEAENQLVHVDKSIRGGRMLSEQDSIHLDKREPDNPYYDSSQHKYIPIDAIPLLIHQNLPGQIMLNETFTQLYTGPLTPEQIADMGGIPYLEQLPHQTIFHGTVPLVQNDPQRFSGRRLLWNGHQWETLMTPRGKGDQPFYYLDLSKASTPAGLTYRYITAPDGSRAYMLVPVGTQGPEVAFRKLIPLQTLKSVDPTKPDVLYDFEEVGQFSDNTLSAQLSNPLNWLPENTYTVPPAILRYDAKGHPLPSTSLLPTTNPAGYIMQPPLALTTLIAARELVGDHCINAIRVRVAGVVAADQEGWKHVLRVAQEIYQQTGLQVVVTLGSSPRPTLVYVPGLKQGELDAEQTIAPIGWVEERWIQIAVALTYLKQLESTRLLLLGTVLAVCLGYLVMAFSSLVATQRREFAILSALGWRPSQPARIFLAQASILAVGGGLGGIGIALLIIMLIEAVPLWSVVAWTLPIMLALALLSSLYPLWQLWHLQPIEMLRAGSSIFATRNSRLALRMGLFLPPIAGLVVRNLLRSRPRTLMAMLSLFLSSILLVLMSSGLLAFHQALQGTLLGDFILLQTAVPQVSGCTFAVLLSFLSVADLLLLQVRERQQEIGLLQALGWRIGLVQRMFVQEGIFLALISTLPGVLVALKILEQQHAAQNVVPPMLIAMSSVLLMVLVAALASIPALRAMNRMQVIYVLRAE